jgi:4-amino-4-deoxy-L-arabinose transferase-like glycosyltransferase
VAVFANSLVFLTVLTFSLYGIGKSLWGRRTGLLAALVAATSPMLVTQFKEFQIDAALTAMAALCLYLLIKCDHFRNKKYSLLLGMALGFSMLTKWTFLPVLILPLIYLLGMCLYRSWKEKGFLHL